jgi:hypothetical protein
MQRRLLLACKDKEAATCCNAAGTGQKVIETLDGRRTTLSSLSAGLLERITNFRQRSSSQD